MEEKNKNRLEKVVYVSWEESEKGWGCRPDGCSLHVIIDDFHKFLSDYWSRMPSQVPNEYERPAGSPGTAYVPQEIFAQIKKSKFGLRLWKWEENELASEHKIVYSKDNTGGVSLK